LSLQSASNTKSNGNDGDSNLKRASRAPVNQDIMDIEEDLFLKRTTHCIAVSAAECSPSMDSGGPSRLSFSPSWENAEHTEHIQEPMYFSQPPLPFEQQTASNMPLESYNTQTNCAQDVPHTQLQFLPPLSIPMPRDVAVDSSLTTPITNTTATLSAHQAAISTVVESSNSSNSLNQVWSCGDHDTDVTLAQGLTIDQRKTFLLTNSFRSSCYCSLSKCSEHCTRRSMTLLWTIQKQDTIMRPLRIS
jgi:hypothetical protein